MIASAASQPLADELGSVPPAPVFEKLLAAAAAREEHAWVALYDRFSGPLLGYLRAQRAREPDDVLGEVFLQAVRDVDSFRGGETDFRAWLFTIARHRLLDEARRVRRRPVELVPPEDVAEHGAHGDAEHDALRQLEESEVTRLLGLLPLAQREVLVLRVVGDLTVEQVAVVVGRRPTAVKALQRRALARLRRELAGQGVSLFGSPALEEVR
jgi:RNA polymerase sigma-70 factor (ECF subfamily)